MEVGDFDVLSVVDHRMRWYTEDAAMFSGALQEVVRRYQRTLFVGASMGGFGALLHGGRLADAIVAFSPQADLKHATLRPPAGDVDGLEGFTAELCQSVAAARQRGALVEVHCAADEHLTHALTLPRAMAAITVHPLVPRKPFARLLDRAGVLLPIISNVLCQLLLQGATVGRVADPELAVACWSSAGSVQRYRAETPELLRLLCGRAAAGLPRPGDWFCGRCRKRNMQTQFFCNWCCSGGDAGSASVGAAHAGDPGACSVPSGQVYPRAGDWGCGRCGEANCGYQGKCGRCGGTRGEHAGTVVVG